MLLYTSQITEKASFFRLPYLEYDFVIADIVRLNIKHVPGTHQWWSVILVKLLAFIPQFN